MCWGTNDRDKKQMLDVFADPPLWQGLPELSDAFFNDFIALYRHDVNPDFWKMNSVSMGCENCERRRLFERRLP